MRRLVIGIGNRDRGDDAVGPIVCDRIARLHVADVETAVLEIVSVDLFEVWCPDDDVTIVDAAPPAGRPGRISETDALRGDLFPPRPLSSHAIDVASAIELARVLGSLPAALTVVGVEGEQFGFGEPLSGPVRDSVDRLVQRLTAVPTADDRRRGR